MSAGSVRVGKFAKYLPEFGWNPMVLTIYPKAIVTRGIPVEVDPWRVARTPYRDPVGLFSHPPRIQSEGGMPPKPQANTSRRGNFREWVKRHAPFTIQRLPDRMLGWYPYAVKAGGKILEWDRVDAIFSSHPTPTSHLVAAKLRRKELLPWVADYRDLWTGSTLRPYPNWLNALERRIERRVLKGAAVLTTVSEPLGRYLSGLHEKPVEVIYNGFDPEDFKVKVHRGDPKIFTMVYSGTLYTGKQSPVPLFEAMKSLMEKGILSRENFRLRFIGVQEPPFRELVAAHALEPVVTVEPFQPYEDNVASLKRADALLFFSWNEGEMEGNPTSKIFQYAGADRPILVVGTGNPFVTEFVRRARLGEVGRNSREIEAILTRWMRTFRAKGSLEHAPDEEALEPYNRKAQAGQLASILDRLTP